jgi:hypothetical protein
LSLLCSVPCALVCPVLSSFLLYPPVLCPLVCPLFCPLIYLVSALPLPYIYVASGQLRLQNVFCPCLWFSLPGTCSTAALPLPCLCLAARQRQGRGRASLPLPCLCLASALPLLDCEVLPCLFSLCL